MMVGEPAAPRTAPCWWKRISLRGRLTAAAAAVITVGVAIAAALLVWRVHTSLARNLDDTLTHQIRAVAAEMAAGNVAPRMSRSAGDPTALQVVDSSGRVIAISGDIDAGPRVFFAAPGVGDPTFATVTSPVLDAPYRVAALTVLAPSGELTLYVGSPTTSLSATTSELGAALTVGVPAMVGALALVGWWLIGRALRPVETMRRQAAAIPGTDLRRRLQVPAAHDELRRLSDTLNDLLGRVENAAERQRRFVADAAHELRNPLAALRTRLELALRHPVTGSEDDSRQAQQGALNEVARLADLVNDLLALARLDAGQPVRRRPLDIDDLVWEAAAEARLTGPPVMDTTGVSPVRVVGDAAGLRRVVRNLVDNARRHANATVTIKLYTEEAEDRDVSSSGVRRAVILTVADDGRGIAAPDRERIFERFERLDDARARDGGGSGLGLAIVAEVVADHGGTVWVEDNNPGARFRVRLPVGSPTAASAT